LCLYILLGDDIVIAEDALAQEYLKLLKVLDIEVSKYKTHTSHSMFEFAKRWYRNNQEVSGIPILGLLTVNQF
jgi:hypothetical protein